MTERSRPRFHFLIVALALFAAGCTTCEVAPPPPAPEPAQPAPVPKVKKSRTKGSYRVGEPYQIAGVWYTPKLDWDYRTEGRASWYGQPFHGRLTANGETYDQDELTAAHQTLPLPSVVRVTNLENGRTLILRVNDRGPFIKGRIIDVSRKAAKLLKFHDQGTTQVRIEVLEKESREAAAELGWKG
ncbi:MAG: septal ring lytic transglycosylase RlpA family protein [Rhodospirillaceae bacterium]|nr:septal ring lytic transglycosylase RlpA family protein [Rhodospirillales bacterium]